VIARSPFETYLDDLLEEFRDSDGGEVATYIPELGRADPDWFSICICTTDGHLYAVGDSDVAFTIQSISKAFMYGAALERHGREAVLARVGVEPSGNPFNAILVDDTNRPFNPMVNAGAIVTTAMVDTDEQVLEVLSRYAGRQVTVDEEVYDSERSTGDRNRAIAFLMRSFGVMADDADAAVDRYFRQCSVSVTCQDLAVMAATLANRGRNPVTGAVALAEPCVESVLSVMSTCGMYDASGDWMFRIGLPAKSGVSGGVIAVLPGQFGIAVFSPRLDARGNSTRGIEVCERIAADFDLHPMRFQPDVGGVIRRDYTCAHARSSRQRTTAEVELLVRHGHRARIFELQGELFLATAERVFRTVIESLDEVDIVVLDCKRVNRVDDPAVRMLEQLGTALNMVGRTLVLAETQGEPDVDVALEWCEERILRSVGAPSVPAITDVGDHELLAGLDEVEVAAVTAALRHHRLAAGEVLFKQGDSADGVFFILSGGLTVQLDGGDGTDNSARRLARLGVGLAVGEMALTGDTVRSADVVADHDTVLVELSTAAVAELAAEHPGLTTHLHLNLARMLADRLRRSNEQLRLLAR